MGIANSLDQCIPVPKKEEENTASEQTKEKGADTEEKKEESTEDEDAETVDELKAKFEARYKRNIEKRVKEESERKVDQNEEDNKEDSKEAASTESEKGDKSKCPPVTSDKKNYGNYGTTFDRFNVCWEFNTFVGCRKGTKCKWAHQYLAKESAHPYTGEKLNGMAVRKFRKSNDI